MWSRCKLFGVVALGRILGVLVEALWSQERFAEAVPALEGRLMLDPCNRVARWRLVHGYRRVGRTRDAVRVCRSLAARHPPPHTDCEASSGEWGEEWPGRDPEEHAGMDENEDGNEGGNQGEGEGEGRKGAAMAEDLLRRLLLAAKAERKARTLVVRARALINDKSARAARASRASRTAGVGAWGDASAAEMTLVQAVSLVKQAGDVLGRPPPSSSSTSSIYSSSPPSPTNGQQRAALPSPEQQRSMQEEGGAVVKGAWARVVLMDARVKQAAGDASQAAMVLRDHFQSPPFPVLKEGGGREGDHGDHGDHTPHEYTRRSSSAALALEEDASSGQAGRDAEYLRRAPSSPEVAMALASVLEELAEVYDEEGSFTSKGSSSHPHTAGHASQHAGGSSGDGSKPVMQDVLVLSAVGHHMEIMTANIPEYVDEHLYNIQCPECSEIFTLRNENLHTEA